jgi:glycosyltransferase involved in cell wall biosynthesis
VFSVASEIDFDYGALVGRLGAQGFRLGVRMADRLVVQTPAQSERARAVFGREGVVIPNIAEPAQRAAGVPGTFLWVGRDEPFKRPGVVLDLAEALPDVPFRVVLVRSPGTDGRLGRAVAERAARLDNVELLPGRPRDELDELYADAVAVVSTSTYEGMPNVLLEGWARGIPALVFSFDPAGVVERHGLGAVAGGDLGRFADEARALWETRAERAALSERCVAHVREHHEPRIAIDRWLDLLAGLGVRPDRR